MDDKPENSFTTFSSTLSRLAVVTGRMRRQVFDAGSTSRVHEEDILEAARLVDALLIKCKGQE